MIINCIVFLRYSFSVVGAGLVTVLNFLFEGSAFPVQESNCKSETHETLSIANGFHQHQEKVSQVASAADLCQNLNDDNRGMQDLSLNPLGLVGTITTKNIESSLCDTEEEGRVKANTTTRAKEVNNEPKAEYKYRSSADIEQQTTTDVDPIGFYISGETTACGILNGCKTEVESEEVTASTGVFDEPFHNYVNTLNTATKTTDLEGKVKHEDYYYYLLLRREKFLLFSSSDN